MGESKHTPGPWEVSIGNDYAVTAEAYPKAYPHHYKSDDLGEYLAYVGNRAEDFGKANARLIAAAPDMLEALEVMLQEPWLTDSDKPKHWAQEQARAAIAKAKGGE